MTFDEVRSLEPAVILDSINTGRRFLVQRIRNQLWYWLTTERDPYVFDRRGEAEIGTIDTVERAAQLCKEFVCSELLPAELTTIRTVTNEIRP